MISAGAQGIGLCLTRRFAEKGDRVFFCDIDREAGLEAESALRKEGLDAGFIPADVGSPDDIERLAGTVRGLSGRLDVLINNAGIGDNRAVADRDAAAWDRIVDVNLRAAYLTVRAFLPLMPEHSSVINISSTRALQSEPGTEPYAASKAGLIGLTHSLAVSLGPKRIRVNCVSPGWIETAEWRKSSERRTPNHSDADRLQHPVGRVGVPDDIFSICSFLADVALSGFVTGQNFVVDGGMTRKMIYV
jgi:NAD(P)-dependent dehydrogenase (short-subunit alcohol dehydrogenase family)